MTHPTIALRLLGAGLCACLLAACAALPLQEDHRQLAIPHLEGSALQVRSTNGNVEVRAADRRDVLIEARIRASSADRLASSGIQAERSADGRLDISVDWADGRRVRNESASFKILMPEAHGVSITTSNGSISISGLAGAADLRTSNGALSVEGHDGPVSARSSNGRLTLEAITGEIDATTTNGRIRAHDVMTPATLRSSNGSVDVRLARDATGPVNVRTSNGNVTLEIGSALTGELELATSRGRVQVDAEDVGIRLRLLERNRAVLAFDRPGADSRIRTSNGSIRLSSRTP